MADTYNIFISWSGERSEKVAAALYGSLKMMLQTARPWMSKEDIEKGSRGLDEVGKALEAMSVGILCLTPENVERPWILFEAGALSKAMGEKTRVCPYLFGGLRSEQVRLPLGMFQAARAEKEETRKLVFAVNRAIGGVADEARVDTWFEREWPELEKKLGAISTVAAAAPPERPEREMVAELLELSRAAAANDGWSKEALVTLLRGVEWLNVLAGEGRVPLSGFSGLSGGAVPLRGVLSDLTGFQALQVPQPKPTPPQAEEQQKAEGRRMHAPSLRRAGRRGKTGGEKK